MKKFLPTVFVLVIFLGLLSYLLLIENKKEDAETTGKKITEIPKDSITAVEVFNSDPYRIEKVSDASTPNPQSIWEITRPHRYEADHAVVTGMIDRIASLAADREITANAAAAGEFGLDTPFIEIEVVTEKEKSFKIRAGNKTPFGNNYYVMRSDQGVIYTVNGYDIDSFNKKPSELRNKSVADFNLFEVNVMIIHRPGGTVRADRVNDETWSLTEPHPATANTHAVEDVLRELKYLRVDQFIDTPRPLPVYGLDKPAFTAILFIAGKDPETIWIGKTASNEGVYLTKPNWKNVVVVKKDITSALSKPVEEFEKKETPPPTSNSAAGADDNLDESTDDSPGHDHEHDHVH